MKSASLEKLEAAEKDETEWIKIIISFLTGLGFLTAVIYVFYSNYDKIGNLK